MMSAIAWTTVLLVGLHAAEGLDNGLSRTPHRGWSSWNKFKCRVDNSSTGLNEGTVLSMAQAIVQSGLAAHGYEYVNLDDCYLAEQRVNGRLAAGPTFPSGLKALGDKLHRLQLKFGVYLDCGTETCGKFPGSAGYEAADAASMAEWGADYMKYDECNTNPLEQELFRFFSMRDAINATGRPIVYTICPAQSRCDGTPGQPYDPSYWRQHNMSLGPLPAGDFWDASSVANVNMCRGDGFESCSGRSANATTLCSNYCGQAHCTSAQNTYAERRKWADRDYQPEDIAANWCSFNCLLDANIAYDSGRVSGPGHWTISDMLEVGAFLRLAPTCVARWGTACQLWRTKRISVCGQ